MSKYLHDAKGNSLFFNSDGAYRKWSKANPNCTCTWDDYSGLIRQHVDCPDHGERKAMVKCQCGDFSWPEGAESPKGHSRGACWNEPAAYDPPPTHYATAKGFDVWDIWDAFDLDRYTAGAIKYLLRAGKKGIAPRLDDLVKARNYIEKAIEFEKSKNGQS